MGDVRSVGSAMYFTFLEYLRCYSFSCSEYLLGDFMLTCRQLRIKPDLLQSFVGIV